MLRQRKERREKRNEDHGLRPLNMSQPRVEASAHNYAPIVASRACCKEEERTSRTIAGTSDFNASDRRPRGLSLSFRVYSAVFSLVKYELFHYSSVIRKNCLTLMAVLKNGQPGEITS